MKKSSGINTSIHNFHVSTTSEVEANRGLKKSKKGQETYVHHAPSQWEYDEGSHGSQYTKRSFTKSIESQPVSQSSRLLYFSQFPEFLHQYIDDIVDMGEDGNCDFN